MKNEQDTDLILSLIKFILLDERCKTRLGAQHNSQQSYVIFHKYNTRAQAHKVQDYVFAVPDSIPFCRSQSYALGGSAERNLRKGKARDNLMSFSRGAKAIRLRLRLPSAEHVLQVYLFSRCSG